MVELESELQRKSSQLIFIDEAITVEVESLEACLDLTVSLLAVVVFHGTYATQELFGILVLIQGEEGGQLVDELLVELGLQVRDAFEKIFDFLLLDVFLWHRHVEVDDWDHGVELVVILHIL